MASLVIVINDTSRSVQELNNKCQNSGNSRDALNRIANYIASIAGGAASASVQVTTRDTDPSVGTHGTNSTQNTYDKS